MQSDELEHLLRLWGRYFGEERPREWDEDSSCGLGIMSSILIDRVKVGKGPQDNIERQRRLRRTVFMSNEKGRRVIDHEKSELHQCHARETQGAGERPWLPDPRADHVDRLCVRLYEHNPVQAVVLRIEYCTRGTKKHDKLPRARFILDNPHLKMRHYRMELDIARDWMRLNLAGRRTAA